jgi:hypothetical protein
MIIPANAPGSKSAAVIPNESPNDESTYKNNINNSNNSSFYNTKG